MSFSAWIKGRVVPINSVLGLREILNNITGSGTNGAQTIADVEGLTTALNNKLETSLLKTTLAGDLDTDIPSVKAVNAALALKLDAAIGFTALTANTTAINLASFAGKRAVFIEYDTALTMTFNNDLKTGEVFLLKFKNIHVSSTLNIAIPVPRGGSSVYATVSTEYNDVYLMWDIINEMWITRSSGSYSKVAS